MVERNPGQQNYDDLVARHGADYDPNATPDYSDLNTDYSAGNNGQSNSSLSNLEKRATQSQNQTTDSISQDDTTGERERRASFETSGFDEGSGKGRSRISGTSHLKKKLISWAIGLICGGGVLTAGFTAVSGPLQLVQAGAVVTDFLTNIVSNQQNARSFNSMNFISRHSITGAAKSSRMGILGEHAANKMTESLANNGLTFADDGSIKIDTTKASVFNGESGLSAGQVAEKLGISDASKISVNGTDITLDHSLKYGDARNALTAMDDAGKNGLASRLQTRSVMKREGYTSWLHPLQKAQTLGENKLKTFINKLKDKINKEDEEKVAEVDDNDKDKINEGADDADDNHHSASPSEVDNDTKEGLDIIEDSTKDLDTLEKNGRRGKIDLSGSKLPTIANRLANIADNPLNNDVFQNLVALFCTAFNAFKDIGAYKWVHIVNPAMRIANTVVGYGSQVKSGEDIDVDTAGLAVKTAMGDDVDLLDGDGNKTAERKTEFNSFWDSPVVCAELQLNNCASEDENTVPSALKTASDSTRLTGNRELDNSIGAAADWALSWEIGDTILQGACLILPLIGDLSDLASIVPIVIGLFTGGVGALPALALDFLKGYALSMVLGIGLKLMRNWMLGSVLNVNDLLPTQWGSVTMFGGKFTANNQALSMGGRKLTSQEAMELKLDNRRYLAWRNSKKSVIARIFDPSDYNSSLNQLARIIKINNSDQSLPTQLANAFKALTSAPTILATANNAVFGGSAYAASRYDYGVSDYAWGMDELNGVVNDNPYSNANAFIDAYLQEDPSLDSTFDNAPLHYYAKTCMGVQISDDDTVKVSQIDNTDGKAWNYRDNDEKATDCKSHAQDSNIKQLRLYVMDYFNTVTSACYNGDATDTTSSEACDEMVAGSGTTTGGSSSSSTSGGASGATGDGAALAAEFEKDTNNTGDYDNAYGRQCVDLSLWYVAKHTTLKSSSCNGNCFVDAMKSANPQLTVITSGVPTAPAVFSTDDGIMGRHNSSYGHTGVVVSVDSDGTIHTIETGNSAGKVWYGTYKQSEYQGARFASVKDYQK